MSKVSYAFCIHMQALSAANIVKKMKLKFTKAWLSFLRLPLPLDVYKEVRLIYTALRIVFHVVPLKINGLATLLSLKFNWLDAIDIPVLFL